MPRAIVAAIICLLFSTPSLAAGQGGLDLTTSGVGYGAIVVFVLAYLLVMGEEVFHLRKSKPVLMAAGIIWGLISYTYVQQDLPTQAEAAFRHNLLAYAEL